MEQDESVGEVLKDATPEVRQLVEHLRTLVRRAAPQAAERGIKGWKVIAYERNGIFAYIAPYRKWANLGFYKGASLPDPEGLLEGTGKGLRHVRIRSASDIRENALRGLVEEAYRLNDA